MSGIDPKWVFYLGILVTIETAVGQGTVKLTNVVPEAWAPFIIGWCNLLSFVGTAFMTAMSGYSSSRQGPLVNVPPPSPPTIVKVLLIAFACSLFLASGAAQAQTPRLTGNIVKDIAAAAQPKLTGDPATDLIKALDAKLLPDLQYALKLAQATNSNVTAPCWQAWIDMIQTQQKAVQDDKGQDIPAPDPHLITTFERMVELRNALQPESQFMLKCSPVASMVKLDIAKFMGVVISGGAGIAALVPGL